MKIFVTGASGFVGRVLVDELLRRGHEVHAALRHPESAAVFAPAPRLKIALTGDLTEKPSLAKHLKDMDAVVHLAARAHVMREWAENPETLYQTVNYDTTLFLARAAQQAGVRRFVFLSSIKALGEESGNFEAKRESDEARPSDAYGRSKLAAERVLLALPRLEVCVLRSPLVYGPGARANFLQLVKAVERGWPLPFASVKNRRSLIYVGNLAHALAHVTEHPKASGELFHVCDGEDFSTPELLKAVGRALGKKPRLLPFPVSLLERGFRALGKEALAKRLCGSLAVDCGKIQRSLDWQAPYTPAQGLKVLARERQKPE